MGVTHAPDKIKTACFVVQKYLERPMLISGRKFDIRVWVLMCEEKVFFFKEGYLRTSSERYRTSRESLDNQYIHLTNNAIQKHSKEYGRHESGNQLSFKHLDELLTKNGFSF